MENLDKAYLKSCPICKEKAEHRFNIYLHEVWACGCWKHEKPIYANSPNHKEAIGNWNNEKDIFNLEQEEDYEIN